MSEGAPARDAQQPRDFVAAGIVTLYWGLGLGTFLSLTHTWFDGVKFYAVSPSVAAIVIDAIGLLALFAAFVSPSRSRMLRKPRRVVVLVAALILWIALGAVAYALTPDFVNLSRYHELAIAYHADATCSDDTLHGMAHHSVGLAIPPERTSGSVCAVAWAKVTEKTATYNCLQLNGPAINGPFCFGVRGTPPCDWSNIHVGDALFAQTAYGRPAAYFCPTRDPVSLPIFGRGVVIETRENPVREFQVTFINHLLAVGMYLLLGMTIAFRLIA